MKRRDCLQALVLPAGLAFGPPLAAAAASPAEHLVYDRRLLAAPELSGLRAGRFAGWHSFAGDVTRVWQDALAPLWREREVHVVGVTRPAECFVLATLGRDYGYRLAEEREENGVVVWRLAPA